VATPPVPAASRLTVRGKKNRRKPASMWSRVPRPRALADSCGRALRRSLPAIAATCALAFIGTGLVLGYRFITTSERFEIDEIQVHGTARLTADDVRAALPVKLGDNVFTANLDQISERLRGHPWIASAEARRVLPHTLVVEIREYEPVAMVQLGELYLVDASGHPFKRAELEAGDGADLPIVTGIERSAYQRDPAGTALTVTSALDVLALWRAEGQQASHRPAIGEIHVDALGNVALRTYDHGTSIEFAELGQTPSRSPTGTPGTLARTGPQHLPARLRTFDAAWSELTDAERKRARAIHLGARVDHVTVAFKD
jgi:cell division protein FtsQ